VSTPFVTTTTTTTTLTQVGCADHKQWLYIPGVDCMYMLYLILLHALIAAITTTVMTEGTHRYNDALQLFAVSGNLGADLSTLDCLARAHRVPYTTISYVSTTASAVLTATGRPKGFPPPPNLPLGQTHTKHLQITILFRWESSAECKKTTMGAEQRLAAEMPQMETRDYTLPLLFISIYKYAYFLFVGDRESNKRRRRQKIRERKRR
jgi:hypothetical protein